MVEGSPVIAKRAVRLNREVFSTYVPSPRGPVFMTLIEKTFGHAVTTCTWDTVEKIVGAHLSSSRRSL